jgi:hypothetical protein
MKRSVLVGLVVLALFACVLVAMPKRSGVTYTTISGYKATPSRSTPTPWYVTLDGYDKAAGITVQTINVWKDYNDRNAGTVGTGRHGEKVEVVRRSGDGVQIELSNGKRGWVTYYFIREFK